MYYTEDDNYDSKEINKLACCSIIIIIGFTLLIASLAGYFSITFLRGN